MVATSRKISVVLTEAKLSGKTCSSVGLTTPLPDVSPLGPAWRAPRLSRRSAVTQSARPGTESGFTLIELMIVMVIIGLLAAIAIPSYTNNVRNGKEAVLREDLHTMREAIDAYTVDKQKAPQSLDDLVQAGYLKVMPVDPFTRRSDTWMGTQSDTLSSVDQTQSGIDDVHSGAQGTSSQGTSYNTW